MTAKPSPLFAALERLAGSGALAPAAMGMFGGGGAPAAAPAPEPIKPVPLPDPEDPAILAERRRQLLRAAGRSGRASTTLSAQEDYSTDKTGVA
jgi:hypothetical protein